MLPFLAGVQEACSRIGVVTGKGIAAVVREHFSKPVLYVVVLLVLIANTINIGADIGAMAAAANLLFPLSSVVFLLLFTTIILTQEIFLPYKVYARVLKWLTLSLLAYPLTVFIVAEPWPTILRATFLPHIELNFQFLFVITGVLGTTISPTCSFGRHPRKRKRSERRICSAKTASRASTGGLSAICASIPSPACSSRRW